MMANATPSSVAALRCAELKASAAQAVSKATDGMMLIFSFGLPQSPNRE